MYKLPIIILQAGFSTDSKTEFCGSRGLHHSLWSIDISLKSQFRQTDLNKHEKIHQEREKTFFCQFCKAGFFKKSYLKIHEQRYGPRPTILETTYPNARHQAVVPVSDFGTSWAIDAIGNACILN